MQNAETHKKGNFAVCWENQGINPKPKGRVDPQKENDAAIQMVQSRTFCPVSINGPTPFPAAASWLSSQLVLGWCLCWKLEQPLEAEGDCDEALGKFVQDLGSRPELYVKSDIVATKENMAKWESNHLTETKDWTY